MSAKTLAPIGGLIPDPDNALVHSDDDVRGLMAKLEEFGQVEPLIVNGPTGIVLGGNGRLEAMKRLGWEQVWVNFVDLDPVKARALSIALNTRKSEWDDVALAEQLREIEAASDDLLIATGFDAESVQALIDDLGDEALQGIPDALDDEIDDGRRSEDARDRDPDVPKKAKIQGKVSGHSITLFFKNAQAQQRFTAFVARLRPKFAKIRPRPNSPADLIDQFIRDHGDPA